jgi:hypothetical protein
LHFKEKRSSMTTFRIQELESLGFEWDNQSATWEVRLSELADYRKIHGHCNVPRNYSENTKLGQWVAHQRARLYNLHVKGKRSPMTTLRIQELESLGFEWGTCITPWEDRLSELADYRKIHGHCNVPQRYSENTKLGQWVADQRARYNVHVKGKRSSMTLSRIRELDKIGFAWNRSGPTWEDQLSALADYLKIYGHCNVPRSYTENPKLATWVATQRRQYRLQGQGKTSSMNTFRIQQLKSLGFEWRVCATREKLSTSKPPSNASERQCDASGWKSRLRELADYRKEHGHCNIPRNCSENSKLGKWVADQRARYHLHVKGKTSSMTLSRIRELESLDFEWDRSGATVWEDRLSELTDYRKIHGNCNVPTRYKENPKLGQWVATQRKQYRLRGEGKKSSMTTFRNQELENLGFEWKPSISRRKGTPQKPSLDDDATRVHKKPANSRQGANSQLETEPSNVILRATGYY